MIVSAHRGGPGGESQGDDRCPKPGPPTCHAHQSPPDLARMSRSSHSLPATAPGHRRSTARCTDLRNAARLQASSRRRIAILSSHGPPHRPDRSRPASKGPRRCGRTPRSSVGVRSPYQRAAAWTARRDRGGGIRGACRGEDSGEVNRIPGLRARPVAIRPAVSMQRRNLGRYRTGWKIIQCPTAVNRNLHEIFHFPSARPRRAERAGAAAGRVPPPRARGDPTAGHASVSSSEWRSGGEDQLGLLAFEVRPLAEDHHRAQGHAEADGWRKVLFMSRLENSTSWPTAWWPPSV